MTELKNLKVSFWDEDEKKKFIEQSKEYYNKRDDGYYFEYDEEKTLTDRQAKFNQNFKEFLYVLWWIIACLLIVFVFYWGFTKKPEPIIKTNTITVTGNTYEVTIDTKKIPAIGSLVYYYDATISVQKWAKLNQIRVDADGITRYNICLPKEEDRTCLVENPKRDPMNNDNANEWLEYCVQRNEVPYTNCFDTSIIGSTEQTLRDWICNK